jgi:hypothetical protein
VTEAIFGLVGVVIGGVLNGGLAWLSERRMAKGSIKVSARLVQSEMEANNLGVSGALFKDGDWAALRTLLSTSAWAERRATMAAAMTDSEWSIVCRYYMQMQATKAVADTHAPFDMVDADEIKRLKDQASMIVKADGGHASVLRRRGLETESVQASPRRGREAGTGARVTSECSSLNALRGRLWIPTAISDSIETNLFRGRRNSR